MKPPGASLLSLTQDLLSEVDDEVLAALSLSDLVSEDRLEVLPPEGER